MSKIRLDNYLKQIQPEFSLEKIKAFIMDGKVLVNEQKITKVGSLVKTDSKIRLLDQKIKYVSRGGEKLAGAIDKFKINIKDRIAMDIGVSTGGFTDYLLQNGVKRVFAIDVAYGDIAYSLRIDPKVVLLERTNARYLTKGEFLHQIQNEKYLCRDKSMCLSNLNQENFNYAQYINLVVMDVSFISILKIMPAIKGLVLPNCEYVILIKPQFEADKSEIGEKGIITDPKIHEQILERVKTKLHDMGFKVKGVCDSPILGVKGNKEFFFYIKT